MSESHPNVGEVWTPYQGMLGSLSDIDYQFGKAQLAINFLARLDPVRAKEVVVQSLQLAEVFDYLAESARACADNLAILADYDYDVVGQGRKAEDVAEDLDIDGHPDLWPEQVLPGVETENLDFRRALSPLNRREEYERCRTERRPVQECPGMGLLRVLVGGK